MDIRQARREIKNGKTIYDLNLRVANYDRVSTDKEEQLRSLFNQQYQHKDVVDSNPNWTLVKSYVDKGKSGTSVLKRKDFIRMIEDAKLGKFDMIITKMVSRFARNTLDSLHFTQELLKCGVIVWFTVDYLNTIDEDSESRLTDMARAAQEEVRRLSNSIKWSNEVNKKLKRLGGGNLTGYFKKDCKIEINPERSPIIEILFNLYATGEYGFKKIAYELADNGYYTEKGKVFSETTLKKLLQNPRFKGCFTANMSYVEDYKTHKKILLPKEEWLVVEDENVPAIISVELWEKCNAIYKERNSKWNKKALNKEFYLEKRYYTSKIFCKEHNTTFIREANGKRKEKPVWRCNEYVRHGLKGCYTPFLQEHHLNKMFEELILGFADNKEELMKDMLEDYKRIIDSSNDTETINKLINDLKEKESLKERLFDMSLRKLINDDEFKQKNEQFNISISDLKNKITNIEVENESETRCEKIIKNISNELAKKLDVKKDLARYVDLFIDKVFVTKINNDRKHVLLEVLLNFNEINHYIDLDFNDNELNYKPYDPKQVIQSVYETNMINRNKVTRIEFDSQYFAQKYLLMTSEQSRVC